jgi:RNase P subunit RPR2
MDHVMNYSTPLLFGKDDGLTQNEIKKMETLRERYTNTLTKAPWKKCPCKICKTVGIEVIIFRSSNRNKRRGFHNLYAYQNHIKNLQPEVKLL